MSIHDSTMGYLMCGLVFQYTMFVFGLEDMSTGFDPGLSIVWIGVSIHLVCIFILAEIPIAFNRGSFKWIR